MNDKQSVPACMRTVRRNIKRLRRERLLTQKELAERMNYSVGHISHVECGVRGMTVDALLAFCAALDTDCNSLVAEPSGGNDAGEIAALLRARPAEYIGMVRKFIITLDTIMEEARRENV